ncbi:MAG: protease inhibitor I42 family protein [Phycisphaerales bacterium]|nr:protease inhibitor I42 family protein [Phycisphaerales bacterium]
MTMKSSLTLAVLFLAVLVVGGCASTDSNSGSNAGRQVQEYTVTVGQTVRVTLVSNRTTGFEWALSSAASRGLNHISITESGYADTSTEKDVMGAPGRQWWIVRGVSVGTARLHLDYRRSWETDTAPAEQAVVTINVTK